MLSSLFGSPSCPIGNRSNCSRLQGNWRMKTRRSSILVWWVANAKATLNSLNSSFHKLVKFDMWPHLCSSWKALCGVWAPMRVRKVGSLIFSYPVHFDNFHQSWKFPKIVFLFRATSGRRKWIDREDLGSRRPYGKWVVFIRINPPLLFWFQPGFLLIHLAAACYSTCLFPILKCECQRSLKRCSVSCTHAYFEENQSMTG